MCAFDPPGDLAELASYASRPAESLEQRIGATSLRFGVLCRFIAFVAVDTRIVNEDGELDKVIQPVEFPAGRAPQAPLAAGFGAKPTSLSAAAARAGEAWMPGAAMGRQTRSMHIGVARCRSFGGRQARHALTEFAAPATSVRPAFWKRA